MLQSSTAIELPVNRRSQRRTRVARNVQIEPVRTGRRYIGLFGNGVAPAPTPGKLIDISCNGLSARVPGRLEVGTQVNVFIEDPTGRPQRTLGTVRNVRDDNGIRTLGIAFTNPMIALGDPNDPGKSVAPDGAEPRALVIDDDPAACGVLDRFFSKRGLRVESVGNADDALWWLRRRQPSLMIVELELGGISGVQLLETISAEGLGALHTWAMSGRADDDQALTALSLGASEFFAKPLDLDHLDYSLQLLAPML